MKFGYQGAFYADERAATSRNDEHLHVPAQQRRAESAHDGPQAVQHCEQRTRYDALYAQEQWTLGRLTLQGALRFDHAWSYFPEQQVGPVAVPADADRLPGNRRASTGYNDITPRVRRWPTTCSATARRRSR